MSTPLYLPRTLNLPRTLTRPGKAYSEADLLAASRYIVVLAEPGGGKTELLASLARQLDASVITASKFSYSETKEANSPLVIDAYDELAKSGGSGIFKLLGKAETANPTHVIISSRSSEWDKAATSAFRDFLGHKPLVVWLQEFNQAEQQRVFEDHAPGEVFADFQEEVERFDLDVLLPNPQFLKLFVGAYVESDRRFADKRSIFSQAVDHLAREANGTVKNSRQGLSPGQKVDRASEAFAELLLSGAEGIGTSEAFEDRMYPQLASVFGKGVEAESILATRLFKPGDTESQHRPVHKIVAEYCAAGYLVKRIADPADPLTLERCLSIIAPNLTVRDDLRGLVGWMASLGNKRIQVDVIDLDPYAVLANGDPSQLDPSSRKRLVRKLGEVEDNDPYFRRGDFRRRFSIAGFFTEDVVDEIRPLLVSGSDGDLGDLILELLTGSPATAHLSEELRHLVLSPTESEDTRLLANACLLELAEHDHRDDCDVLISEASKISLEVVAGAIETLGSRAFGLQYLAGFLRVCASLYPGHQEQHERTIGPRYFVKRFIRTLDLTAIEWLLDELTQALTCTCGKNHINATVETGSARSSACCWIGTLKWRCLPAIQSGYGSGLQT